MERGTICFVGANSIGVPVAAVFALKCPKVKVNLSDISEEKLRQLESRDYVERYIGLDEILTTCKDVNLHIRSDIRASIAESDLVFICDDAPLKKRPLGLPDAPDFEQVEKVTRLIAEVATDDTIVIEKLSMSTKTGDKVKSILEEDAKSGVQFQVLSNPELPPDDDVISALLDPKRIIIGCETHTKSKNAAEKLASLYKNWVPTEKIVTTDSFSAHLSKIATNAFLAQRLCSMNAISAICEETGAAATEVAAALGRDSRIGPNYLHVSIGLQSKELTDDVTTLIYLCKSLNLPEVARYWQKVLDLNNYQKKRFVDAIFYGLKSSVAKKDIAFLGRDFDRTEALQYAIEVLLFEGAKLHFYTNNTKSANSSKISRYLSNSFDTSYVQRIVEHEDIHAATENCHALIVFDGELFRSVDFNKIYKLMKRPALLLDVTSSLDSKSLKAIGFQYRSIAK